MPEFILPTLSPVSHSSCVEVLAGRAIRAGAVVIDAGAGDGSWTAALLAAVPTVEVHCFEPDRTKYRQMLIKLSSHVAVGRVVPHNASIGWTDSRGTTAWASLLQYAHFAGLKRLPFVRLGEGVPVTAALEGCKNLIQSGFIEFILAYANAQQESVLVEHLLPNRYEIFRHPAMTDQVLCVCDRFRATIKNERPAKPDVLQLCREFAIACNGVIHIGAGDGHEATNYVAGGFSKTLMIEADPKRFGKLQSNVSGLPGVMAVGCAASDRNGAVELESAADECGSMLLVSGQSQPTIRQNQSSQVAAKTVDKIVQELGQNPADFTLLNLSIGRGAIPALKGAIELLPGIQAIYLEVNFDSQREDDAPVELLDVLLAEQGFDRAVTASPFQPSAGFAFYVRRRPAPVPKQSASEFLFNARNTLVGGWLSIPTASLREAWEGATGVAHRHLIANGVQQLPPMSDDDRRVKTLLETGLPSAGKDRRLQLFLALMLYVPAEKITIAPDAIPGWLRKSLPSLNAPAPIAA